MCVRLGVPKYHVELIKNRNPIYTHAKPNLFQIMICFVGQQAGTSASSIRSKITILVHPVFDTLASLPGSLKSAGIEPEKAVS
jgi:hypothetical protein